jgi:NAD(P)-dependent dehydrogenase (short-subunit alcohol dehydrogenase family)
MVVSGATSGLGRAVAQGLARQGIAVIGIGRNPELCRQAEHELNALSHSPVRFLVADLALQARVRRVAVEIRGALKDWGAGWLNALINNAAAVPTQRTLTSEGFDLQWAVNHLAPFLLTHELLPLLQAAPWARLVTVSSGSHYRARPDWEDLRGQGRYFLLRTYARTKLANVLFTAELNRRLGTGSTVRAFAAQPGLVNTEIGMKSNSRLAYWFWNLWRRHGLTPEESARGIIYLATEPSIQNSGEVYWRHGQPKLPSKYALDPEMAGQLWKISAQACGLTG